MRCISTGLVAAFLRDHAVAAGSSGSTAAS